MEKLEEQLSEAVSNLFDEQEAYFKDMIADFKKIGGDENE